MFGASSFEGGGTSTGDELCALSVLVGTVMVTDGNVWFSSVLAQVLRVANVIVVLLLGGIGDLIGTS